VGEFITGFVDCLDDFPNANALESPDVEAETSQQAETSEDPRESTQKFYGTLFAAETPSSICRGYRIGCYRLLYALQEGHDLEQRCVQ
jgi:hypothetical protein